MAALNDAQLAYLKSELGQDVDLVDMQARYDRLGTVRDVALEVTRGTLNGLLRAPAQFDVPGQYSQSQSENIKGLERKLARIRDEEPDGVLELPLLAVQTAHVKKRRQRT